MSVTTQFWIITLIVNGVNALIKRYKIDEWIKKYKNSDTSGGKTHRDNVKGWKRIFYVHGNKSKVGAAILTSEKIDF